MPLVSRGITKGESDWCQVVAPVTSHTGTGAPVSDPHIVNSEPVIGYFCEIFGGTQAVEAIEALEKVVTVEALEITETIEVEESVEVIERVKVVKRIYRNLAQSCTFYSK